MPRSVEKIPSRDILRMEGYYGQVCPTLLTLSMYTIISGRKVACVAVEMSRLSRANVRLADRQSLKNPQRVLRIQRCAQQFACKPNRTQHQRSARQIRVPPCFLTTQCNHRVPDHLNNASIGACTPASPLHGWMARSNVTKKLISSTADADATDASSK